MKNRIPALALAIGLAAAVASPASAQFAFGRSKFYSGQLVLNGTTTITAFRQGQWTNLGGSNTTNPNYLVGKEGGYVWNDYFMFMIPDMAITSAALRLNSGTVSGGPLEVSFHDVSTSAETLQSGGGGIATYEDLRSGVRYGARVYNNSDTNTWQDIELGGAIFDLNAAAGAEWSVGGTAMPGEEISPPRPIPPPDVTATPEPASLVLLGTGLLGILGITRSRRA